MSYDTEPIIINTDELNPPTPSGGLWDNRAAAYHMYDAPGVPKCSVAVTAYNRLEKTKYCVECILNYTQDIDYELILIDNGSEDGTFEFFRSVAYEKKKIIKISKNIGAGYAWTAARRSFSGKYLIVIPNDTYVTKNWLSNLLKCYESNPEIGFVAPVSSNVSNLQEVKLEFSDFDDMQEKAAAFNKSDPSKWEERMRLISIISIFSRPVLDIVGISDAAYLHDFIEDDFAVRLRRAGYKLMLCRDTWVCHDHDFRNLEDKDPAAFQASLESGRRIYSEKHHGIDPWDDINNFEFDLLAPLDTVAFHKENLSALTIEPRCGTPVLEIRNHLKRRDMTVTVSCAFTSQAKYYLDLQTVADYAACDRLDFISDVFDENSFDIIAFCEPVNIYSSGLLLLKRLYGLLKPDGILLFKVRNADGFMSLLRCCTLGMEYDHDLPSYLSINEMLDCLMDLGGCDISFSREFEFLTAADQNVLFGMLRGLNPNAGEDELTKLITKNHIFKVIKG